MRMPGMSSSANRCERWTVSSMNYGALYQNLKNLLHNSVERPLKELIAEQKKTNRLLEEAILIPMDYEKWKAKVLGAAEEE